MVNRKQRRYITVAAILTTLCLLFVTIFHHQDEKSLLDQLGVSIPRLDQFRSKNAEASKDLVEDPGKPFNAKNELANILNLGPIVIFSKTYCPYSKDVKYLLLTRYQLYPKPHVVELDKHPHGAQLQEYLSEFTGRRTVPNVLIGGISRGGADDILALHEKRELVDSIKKWSNKKVRVNAAPLGNED